MSVASLLGHVMAASQYLPQAESSVAVVELAERDREEVLGFLAERPVHTVALAGLIRDNGFASEHNRGTFFGCRNSEGRLEGVALVGHHTLVEGRTRRAIREFAAAALSCPRTHMILGELETVEEFWNAYADEGRALRVACRELLFGLREAVGCNEGESHDEGPRRAVVADLELILPVHAVLAASESGVNPLDVDPEGFRRRCLRRVEQGRTWVVTDGQRLVFKADVQADTPEVVYLEGVYAHHEERGTGAARKHLTRLCRRLLATTRTVCLLANEENERAQRFYRGCGFKLRGVYDTIFLRRD